MTRESDIILALVDDGHYIEYFGGRKTVADSNFIQIRDTKQRLRDIETVFILSIPELSAINSTVVRDIIIHGGDAGRFIPKAVKVK